MTQWSEDDGLIEVTGAFQGFSQPLHELIDDIHRRGWTVSKLHIKDGQYQAEAKNPHQEKLVAAGRTDATAVANLLVKVMRREFMRGSAVRRKLGAWDPQPIEQQFSAIAQAYAGAPVYEAKAAPAWMDLAQDLSRRAQIIRMQVTVEYTADPTPYESADDLREAVTKKRHILVTTAYTAHPVWSEQQMLDYRLCVDVLGHVLAGGDWGWHGTCLAFAQLAPLLADTCQKALYTELLGQAAFGAFYRQWGPQKIAFLDKAIEKLQEKENKPGHTGVHPSQSIVPSQLPSIFTKVANTPLGVTDPNADWQSGVNPLPDNAYLWQRDANGTDPLNAQGVTDGLQRLECGISRMHPQLLKHSVVNGLRQSLLGARNNDMGHAVHYQTLMHLPADVDDPMAYSDALEQAREQWNQARGYAPGAHKQYWPEEQKLLQWVKSANPHLDDGDVHRLARQELYHMLTEEEERILAQDEGEQLPAEVVEHEAYEAIRKRLKALTKPAVDQKVDFGEDHLFHEATHHADMYPPYLTSRLRPIAQISRHADELADAARQDLLTHHGHGHHFRATALNLGIPGLGPRQASHAWLYLAPQTSQLGIINPEVADALGHDYATETTNRDYFKHERELAAGRDGAGYGHMPLGAFSAGLWDLAAGGPGWHPDRTPLKAYAPTPHHAVDWTSQVPGLGTGLGDPYWWKSTQEARDGVAQDFDRNVAVNHGRDEIPFQKTAADEPNIAFHDDIDPYMTELGRPGLNAVGYWGRWPTIYDGSTVHVGPEGSTHRQLAQQEGVTGGLAQTEGWIGHNPEFDSGLAPTERTIGSTKVGWYNGSPGPHIDYALATRQWPRHPDSDADDPNQGYGHGPRLASDDYIEGHDGNWGGPGENYAPQAQPPGEKPIYIEMPYRNSFTGEEATYRGPIMKIIPFTKRGEEFHSLVINPMTTLTARPGDYTIIPTDDLQSAPEVGPDQPEHFSAVSPRAPYLIHPQTGQRITGVPGTSIMQHAMSTLGHQDPREVWAQDYEVGKGSSGTIASRMASEIPLDQIAYIAEGAVERSGLTGRSWTVTPHRYRDETGKPIFDPAETEMTAFARQVTGNAHITVRATNWFSGGDTAKGETDFLNYISVRYETDELTLLHECAHILRGQPGHDAEWMQIAYGLYTRYLGAEAGETFWNLVSPFIEGTQDDSGTGTIAKVAAVDDQLPAPSTDIGYEQHPLRGDANLEWFLQNDLGVPAHQLRYRHHALPVHELEDCGTPEDYLADGDEEGYENALYWQERYLRGESVPPLTVSHPAWAPGWALADGRHRLVGARAAGIPAVEALEAFVPEGTQSNSGTIAKVAASMDPTQDPDHETHDDLYSGWSSTHDYDPRWDYATELRPHWQQHPLIQQAQARLDSHGAGGRVYAADLEARNAVGMYIHGTGQDEPVILADPYQHERHTVSSQEAADQMSRTVDHEYRHALQDAEQGPDGPDFDEDDAESWTPDSEDAPDTTAKVAAGPPEWLYHHSPLETAHSIRSEGLRAKYDQGYGERPGIYLTTNPQADPGTVSYAVNVAGLSLEADPTGEPTEPGHSWYVSYGDIEPSRVHRAPRRYQNRYHNSDA